MLTIRKDQMAALATPSISVFLERAVSFLYENFPESLDEDPGELTEAAGGQLERAESYGLVTEQQAMTYITSAWLLGPEFDKEFPAAKETLVSEDFSPDEKKVWLSDWTEKIFAALEKEGT